MKISIRSMFAHRTLFRCSALSVVAMFAVSCATPPEEEEVVPVDPNSASNELPAAEVVEEEPVLTRVGQVMGVGEQGRFVVIALDTGAMVETGDTLKARFAGSETAVLKVTPERRGKLVTADVVAGTPAKDHEVVK